jgi:glucokinase
MTTGRNGYPGNWPALVGDVGGTHARFGIVESPGEPVTRIGSSRNDRFGSLQAAVEAYLADYAAVSVKAACLAVAGPIGGDRFKFSNIGWEFSQRDLARALGLSELRLVNDFEALALAVPELDDNAFLVVGGGDAIADAPTAVVGPGTGLGVATLLAEPGGWRAIATEGGHADFAPVTDLEISVLHCLRPRFHGQVSAENVLCGPGISALHDALAAIGGRTPPALTTAAIIEHATAAAPDPECVETLAVYCEILGGFVGNVALITGARGGVVLGGGILPRITQFLCEGGFRRRFEAKGMMRDYVAAIPTRLILTGDAALAGAAAVLLRTR